MNEIEEMIFSELGGGEQYTSIDNVIAAHPDCVTVNGCRAIRMKDGSIVPGFTFAEDSGAIFPAASGDLKKMFEQLLDYCCGDESKVNNLLKEKNARIKICKVPQKKRPQPYVKIKRPTIQGEVENGND